MNKIIEIINKHIKKHISLEKHFFKEAKQALKENDGHGFSIQQDSALTQDAIIYALNEIKTEILKTVEG